MMVRKNITVNKETFEQFDKIAKVKGIKFSIWVNSKMEEFVDLEKSKVQFFKPVYFNEDRSKQIFEDSNGSLWERDVLNKNEFGEWIKSVE